MVGLFNLNAHQYKLQNILQKALNHKAEQSKTKPSHLFFPPVNLIPFFFGSSFEELASLTIV